MKIDGSGLGVIFDLDGVLVDTGWAHKQAWFDLGKHEGFQMPEKLFWDTFGMQNYHIIPMILGDDISAEEIERMSLWKEKRYREIVSVKLSLADGVEALLEDLDRERFNMAVGSSAPRANVELFIKATGLDRWINVFVTQQDVKVSKPAPDTFLKAAEKLGLGPKCCAVVEDAVQGVEAGKAAGMVVVAVTTTRGREELADADMIIDSLVEVRAKDFVGLLNGQAG